MTLMRRSEENDYAQFKAYVIVKIMFGSVSNFTNRTLQLVRYNIIVVHILKHMHAYLYYSYGSIFGDLNFINTLLAKVY